MAGLLRQILAPNSFKLCIKMQSRGKTYHKKYKTQIRKVKMPECRKLESVQDSYAKRGFLRSQLDYEPPADVQERLTGIYEKTVGPLSDTGEPVPLSQKFDLLSRCYKEFNYGVPNSLLHKITTFDDVVAFYATPVDSALPLEKLKRIDLPENLHIQFEPLRFHPDDDTLFNGQTAFPKSNTIVTSLKAKRKYKGCKVVEPWPVY